MMNTYRMTLDRLNTMTGGPDECRVMYAQWANTYEKDVLEEMGYVGPKIVAEKLETLLPKDALILDAGCGTGLVGHQLADKGFSQIDGVDLCENMLALANEKRVYRQLAIADLTQPLELPDNYYDAVVSVGVFTNGHVGPKALSELIRVAKPSAPIIISVHEHVWKPESYPEHLVSMAIEDLIYINHITEMPYHQKTGSRGQLCVLEKIQ